MSMHHVAHRYLREVAVPRLARLRTNRGRSRSAVAGAEDVRANDEVAVRVKEASCFHRMRPPVCHIRVSSQRMAHPYHIVLRRRKRAESVICNLESGQPMPTLQIKRIIVCVYFHRLSEKFFYFFVEDNLLLEDVSTGLRRLNHLNALAMCATRVTCLQSRNRFLCHSSKMLMIT